MVKRARVEATGETEQDVADELAKAAREMKELFGGDWLTDVEMPPTINSYLKGYWGQVTIVRKETLH